MHSLFRMKTIKGRQKPSRLLQPKPANLGNMPENNENGSHSNSTISVKSRNNRCRSFHYRYLELCRAKNSAPLADIRKNNKDQTALDFFGDKLSVSDWLIITESIFCDQVLQTVSIRLRRCLGTVLDHMDTERKAKLFKQKPVIYTKFVFSGIVESLSNCIEFNKNLRVLILEGLPLSDAYVESIAKSLSSNCNLKEVSFARSNIFDKGCESICNTIKYLENIEKLNLSDTGLTTKGAECIADMIKIQKISRYTEGWQNSLRYRKIDTNNIPGLRTILLARNPQIGDEGLSVIVEVLKEDVWIKVVDMESCGLSDRAANILLDCLSVNNFLVEFNVRGNPGISKFLLRSISDHLKKDGDEARPRDEHLRDYTDGHGNRADLIRKPKVTIQQLLEQLKAANEQLELERRLRKKAEQLNDKLTAQIIAYESKLESMGDGEVPEGYVIVKNESLQSIIRERNDLQKRTDADQMLFVEPNKNAITGIKKLSFRQDEECEVQFTTPLPEPSATPSESARSSSARQPSKVRKVKSEMKYVDTPKRDTLAKRKETKSDYDYATESDVPRFETNIGDTVANQQQQQQQQLQHQQLQHQHQHQQPQQTTTRRTVHYASNINIIKKYELDDISLATSRSQASDAASAESETLRCNDDTEYQQMKACKTSKYAAKEYGQGEGAAGKRSPRSLFLGLCDD